MSKWSITSLDREFASGLLQSRAHHLQSSLRWFDFISEVSEEEDRSVALYQNGRPVAFFCALQFRNLIQSLPYPASYSGLQIAEDLDACEVRQAYEVLFEHYSKYCDVLSICSSPLFSNHQCNSAIFDFEPKNVVHVLDLTGDPMTRTTSKFRNNLQRNLRKAELAGVEIKMETGTKHLESWYRCYEKRIAELRGMRLPLEYFETMFRHLQDTGNCSLITAKAGGKFLGGIVTVQNNHCIDYYLSMFDRDEDDRQASTAAFHFAVNSARQRGIPIMNLQSSPRSQTALVHFKESWGAFPARHQYRVKILNNKAPILQLTTAEISQEYPFHFVVPFDALHSEPALVSGNDHAFRQ